MVIMVTISVLGQEAKAELMVYFERSSLTKFSTICSMAPSLIEFEIL